MRILFNSQLPQYKTPFGCLTPEEKCTLNIHIPSSVDAKKVECVIRYDGSDKQLICNLEYAKKQGAYDIFRGTFALCETGLYFYHFRIHQKNHAFRLFKQGDDTNMESGDLWQVSCVPADFETPDWAKGALIYQVFPDRFY